MTATVHTRVVQQRAAPVRLRGDDVDQALPELLKVGGPAALVVVLYWLLATGRIVVGKVYEREAERADRLQEALDSTTKALEGIATSENLAVALLKSVERKAAENDAREGGEGQ